MNKTIIAIITLLIIASVLFIPFKVTINEQYTETEYYMTMEPIQVLKTQSYIVPTYTNPSDSVILYIESKTDLNTIRHCRPVCFDILTTLQNVDLSSIEEQYTGENIYGNHESTVTLKTNGEYLTFTNITKLHTDFNNNLVETDGYETITRSEWVMENQFVLKPKTITKERMVEKKTNIFQQIILN